MKTPPFSIFILLATLLALCCPPVCAQTAPDDSIKQAQWEIDTVAHIQEPPLTTNVEQIIAADSAQIAKPKRNWAAWQPKPKVATWLAICLPGAGQMYNRKFWKLPIVYGAFVGCAYAVRWNNMMYKDYKHGYHDLVDDDETTTYYQKLIHSDVTITEANKSRYEDLFKQRKDRYRRWRDLSIFATIGVYLLQVIDAYVDASLSEFDISNDLSLTVEPAIMGNPTQKNPVKSASLGVQCAINF